MTEPEKRSGMLKEVLSFTETLLVTFLVFTLVFTYIVSVTTVRGASMESTLKPGEKLMVLMFSRSPEPGDIVIINSDDAVTLDENGRPVYSSGINKTIVKRVIAVGGQTIDIDFERGSVCVDGQMLDEAYLEKGLTHTDSGAFTGKYPITVPEGFVFVMGDNRNVSKDSRSSEVGLVPVDNITGRAVLRIYPFSSFGVVD